MAVLLTCRAAGALGWPAAGVSREVKLCLACPAPAVAAAELLLFAAPAAAAWPLVARYLADLGEMMSFCPCELLLLLMPLGVSLPSCSLGTIGDGLRLSPLLPHVQLVNMVHAMCTI